MLDSPIFGATFGMLDSNMLDTFDGESDLKLPILAA